MSFFERSLGVRSSARTISENIIYPGSGNAALSKLASKVTMAVLAPARACRCLAGPEYALIILESASDEESVLTKKSLDKLWALDELVLTIKVDNDGGYDKYRG